MKTKVKLSLILWAFTALFLSFWSVSFAMSGVFHDNSRFITFTLSFLASISVAVCGAGFMQQWLKK